MTQCHSLLFTIGDLSNKPFMKNDVGRVCYELLRLTGSFFANISIFVVAHSLFGTGRKQGKD